MGVMLHPNPEKPERYRVLDKELGVQEYFSFVRYGKLKAKKMAYARQEELDRLKHIAKLRAELGINKLFDVDGSVKGLRRKSRKREGRKEYEFFSIQVTIASKQQKKKEISLMNRSFDEAYALVQQSLLKFHNIDRTAEITRAFKEVKRLYW